MEDITNLITALPAIISYFVYGTLFITIFNFITHNNKETDAKINILSCITISFIVKMIFSKLIHWANTSDQINIVEGTVTYYLLILVFTTLAAYLLGRICISKPLQSLLLSIGIERTTNSNIWVDIIEPYTWLYLSLKGEDFAYYGEVEYVEENCSNPKVVLNKYCLIKMSTAEIVMDFSNEPNKKVMVDVNNVDIIEIDYKKDEYSLLNRIKKRISHIKESNDSVEPENGYEDNSSQNQPAE